MGASDPSIIITNETGNINEYSSILFGFNTVANAHHPLARIQAKVTNRGSGTESSELTFAIGPSLNTALTIADDLHVGIGETDPDVNLHIKDTRAAAYPWIYLETTQTNQQNGIKLINGDSTSVSIFQDGNDADKLIIVNTDAGYNYGAEGVYMADAEQAFTTRSDKRVKTNIKTIEGCLDKVNAIRGVYFNLKSDANKKAGHKFRKDYSRVGVIAQELQGHMDHVVEDSNPDILGVNYEKIVPYLIEAIKELTTKVTALENA